MSSIDSKIARIFKDHFIGRKIDPALVEPFERVAEGQSESSYFSKPLSATLTADQFEVDLSSEGAIFDLLTANKDLLGKGLPPELVRDLLKLRRELGDIEQRPELSELIYVMY